MDDSEKNHHLLMPNGETVLMSEGQDGCWLCPICLAESLPAPAYNLDTGKPSFAFCSTCENQLGWDDKISPQAPVGSQVERWGELREIWLRKK